MMTTRFCAIAALVMIGFAVPSLRAEPIKLILPAAQTDFALDPKTGDVATVSATENSIHLYRHADLLAGKTEPAVTLPIGGKPSGVCYKVFGDNAYFAAVCENHRDLSLFNANDLSLVKKITLGKLGLTSVGCSSDPTDPFLYYTGGVKNNRHTGVFDLRKMANRGDVCDIGTEIVLSADGTVAYLRNESYAPSTIRSFDRHWDGEAPAPTFTDSVKKTRHPGIAIPDRRGELTAVGAMVFDRSLKNQFSNLPLIPYAFFEIRPLMIGIHSSGVPYRDKAIDQVTIGALSTITFEPIGEQITVTFREKSPPKKPVVDNSRSPGRADRMRMFIDEPRQHIVYALGNQLALIPIADLKIGNEPVLDLALSTNTATIGRDNAIELVTEAGEQELTVDQKPDGMYVSGKSLRWRPTKADLGAANVLATLRVGGTVRSFTLPLTVAYPYVKLPFTPSGFTVTTGGSRVVIWDGPTLKSNGRFEPDWDGKTPTRIVSMSIAPRAILAERKIMAPVRAASATQHHVMIEASRSPNSKCDVLRIADLSRVKTISTDSNIQGLFAFQTDFLVRTNTAMCLYADNPYTRTPFQEVRSVRALPVGRHATDNLFTRRGILFDGVLYDSALKPIYLLNLPGIMSLPAVKDGSVPLPLRQQDPSAFYCQDLRRTSEAETDLDAFESLDCHSGLRLVCQTKSMLSPGRLATSYEHNFYLEAESRTTSRELIFTEPPVDGVSREPSSITGHIQANDREVFLVIGDRLYRLPMPMFEKRDLSTVDETKSDDIKGSKLRFFPAQSTISVDGKGTTDLNHEVLGGVAPFEFAIGSTHDGISLNAKTGTITIDERVLMDQALEIAAIRLTLPSTRPTTIEDLKRPDLLASQVASQILGRPVEGFPATIPIAITVTDNKLETADLKYHLLIEIPYDELAARMKIASASPERDRGSPPATPPRTPVSPFKDAADEAADKRIERLEDRSDQLEP